MKTLGRFRMKVLDVFFMSDKVAFVGDMETETKFLGPVDCRLLVGGQDRGMLHLEGESLFTPEQRSVWTREIPNLKKEEVSKKEIWLIGE